ncbi:MAG: 16S rRNA (adenine(1518)-N(6)/adenine(1519)-N(6))-dimethyltransferase RsmA [Acidobacteriia bacterium]|nr:16S rRNA (adenine(1518)-N(6)/adenine(1519)-N(6))-dimethyltransferase RsmA [Terriglobia bacterium]
MAERSRVNLRGTRKGKMAKSRLGQNFLADRSAAERIVDALGDISHSLVMEIGPGRGALTDILAQKAGRMIAIELDPMLAAGLRMKYSDQQNVEILEGDVLAVDFRTALNPPAEPLSDAAPSAPGKVRVIGNLPYYITSDILLRLFEFHELFDQIVIMVQLEVAERIAARPGTRDYGLLSATTQLYTQAQKLFTLPPGAFSPPPRVQSAVVRLTVAPRFQELGVPAREFIDFLKLAFAMKRKTLMNNLKKSYPEDLVRAALQETGTRQDIRAEALPLEESAEIFRRLAKKNISPRSHSAT